MGAIKHDPLLIDMGNSRIKYTWVVPGQPFETQITYDVDDLHQVISTSSEVVMASVRHSLQNQVIADICQHHGIGLRVVETEPQCFGIQCAYTQYQNLGVDRWLAVLGVRALTDLPAAVIDLGTAATCDFVVQDQHLGGWITPGFSMMRDSVASGAARVFADSARPTQLFLGRDTPDCVNMGCLALIQGMVIQAQRQLEAFSNDYRIYLCGGDQDLIENIDSDKIIFEKNIVFLGLKRFLHHSK